MNSLRKDAKLAAAILLALSSIYMTTEGAWRDRTDISWRNRTDILTDTSVSAAEAPYQ
jgi:hypothetical protein